MRSFIVPPPWLCGWRIIATGARGRGGGEKRPSRRPSGPGKITEGIGEILPEMLVSRRTGWCARSRGLYSAATRNRNSFEYRPIPERIYLDHAATTPLRPEARAAMEEG